MNAAVDQAPGRLCATQTCDARRRLHLADDVVTRYTCDQTVTPVHTARRNSHHCRRRQRPSTAHDRIQTTTPANVWYNALVSFTELCKDLGL